VRTEYDGPIRVDRLNLPYFKKHDPGGWQLGIRAWRQHQKHVTKLAQRMLADWTPDLVQFHTPYPVDEEFLIAIQRQGIPVVGMSHCAWTICPRLNLLRSPTSTACSGPSSMRCLECLYSYYDGNHFKAALKLPWRILKLGLYPAYRLWRRNILRRGVRGQVSYSKFMTATHNRNVGGESRFISLGIDQTGLSSDRPLRPRSPLRLGFMAGFQAHKGIWHLLDSAASLKRRGLMFELHIWGPHQEGKQGEITARGLKDRVVLHGTFTSEERWRIYSEIDLLVMATTVCEAYGRVVQEAAAAGVPTLAPAAGGILEQIEDGVDGLLYRFRDREDLERQIARVIEQPSLVNQLAESLRPIVDTRAAIAGIEAFYFETLEGDRSTATACSTPLVSEVEV
jgi:glycosyltransferase involved in cell wall biosynthesis